MVKIAFGYKRRVGKDTSCDYLIKKYGGVKLSFAEPLYDILYFSQKICGFKQTKDRKFLQYIGTEWARTIKDNVWVEILMDKIDEKNNQNIYISDLRFMNELEALKKKGFICVKINHNKTLNNIDGYSDHQSDMDLDNFNEWDYTINNDNDMINLYSQLDKIWSDFTLTLSRAVGNHVPLRHGSLAP